MSKTYYYNIKNLAHLRDITGKVCDLLGHGKNYTAAQLLVETAAAETQCATFQDPTPNGAGYGPHQFDQIGFTDVKVRTRKRHKRAIMRRFGIDIDAAQIEDLATDPLLSTIFCRLKYILIPEEVPEAMLGRAFYWKRHYNTMDGKGTIEHYIESATHHLTDEGS